MPCAVAKAGDGTYLPPEPRAAGAFIALAVIAGAIVGVALQQPSAGVVGGAAVGIAVAVALWLKDRAR